MKLVQKSPLKGTLSFELFDDRVEIEGKRPLKRAESLTVMLTVLNPEPVITRSSLDFVSRVNGEALISLWLEKPDKDAFNQFVAAIKQGAEAAYADTFRLRSVVETDEGHGQGRASQVGGEPPEFGEDELRVRQDVDVASVDASIEMLVAHVGEDAARELINALRELRDAPDDIQAMNKVVIAFNGIGPLQGAVLTYAPYLSALMSDDPFTNR